MKTQFQYKNFDFIKISVSLGQAVGGGVGVGRSRGQEPASAASSEGRSIDGWELGHENREETLSAERRPAGQGGRLGSPPLGQGEVGREEGAAQGSYNRMRVKERGKGAEKLEEEESPWGKTLHLVQKGYTSTPGGMRKQQKNNRIRYCFIDICWQHPEGWTNDNGGEGGESRRQTVREAAEISQGRDDIILIWTDSGLTLWIADDHYEVMNREKLDLRLDFNRYWFSIYCPPDDVAIAREEFLLVLRKLQAWGVGQIKSAAAASNKGYSEAWKALETVMEGLHSLSITNTNFTRAITFWTLVWVSTYICSMCV